MLTTVVITVFGQDRPGLVESVAARVASEGGNWLESRLLHLGGHFAGIVRIEIEKSDEEKLLTTLRDLEPTGLSVVAHEAGVPDASPRKGQAASIEIVGHDRTGIVREISRVLAEHGVNVEELETERTSAPMTGEPIFRAQAAVVLPEELNASNLQVELEKIASDLMVDLSFRAGP